MKVKGTDFVLYHVRDLDRSLEFYRDFLGLPLEFYKEEWKWAELNAGNLTVTLCGESVDDAKKNGGVLALAVEDLSAAFEEVKRSDVPVVRGLHELETCWHLEILDPDGYRIILHQRKDGSFGQDEGTPNG